MVAAWPPLAVDPTITGAIIGGVVALIGTGTTVAMWWIDRTSRKAAETIVHVIFVPVERSAEAVAPAALSTQAIATILRGLQG